MKNIFKILGLFALMLSFGACEDGNENSIYDAAPTAFFLDKFATAKAPITGSKEFDIKVGTMSPVAGATVLSIEKVSGTAVLGTDYEILNGGSVTIPAGGNSGIIKIKVNGANLSQTIAKTLVFDLVSPTIQRANFNNQISLSLVEGCDSDLAGTYTYSTTNFGRLSTTFPGPITGSGTLNSVADGLYLITDASFGAYDVLYGGGDSAKQVRFKDSCAKLTFDGKNQYGDTFSISNVSVNGNKLSFNWTTDYGEFGTTVLTRTDGKDWPANLFSS